jgi:uncharacterized protein YhaN
VLGLATGSTPIGIYDIITEAVAQGELDVSKLTTFNLDEYVNLPVTDPNSYLYFMKEHLFDRIGLSEDAYNIPNGNAADVEAECLRYEEAIKAALQVQEQEYDRAKDFMDNLERRSKDDEKYHTRVEQLTQEISYAKAAIDSLIRQVKSYEDYEVLKEESARLGEKIAILQRKYDALQLARTVLSESFEKWQSDLGPVFAKTARTILYDITKGRHENMKIDRDFEISLPDNSTGRLYPSGYFSGATIDQMYLALRLALVKLISSDTVAFPVIFDDPFVQYDKTRRLSAIEVLSRFAENNETQVIITACVRDDYPENVNVINL